MLLRFVGRGGRRRVENEIVVPVDEMSDEWLLKTFFAIKKEGMRRKLLSRYGYKKKREVQDIVLKDGTGSSGKRTSRRGNN